MSGPTSDRIATPLLSIQGLRLSHRVCISEPRKHLDGRKTSNPEENDIASEIAEMSS
jgi:hypothetical protein